MPASPMENNSYNNDDTVKPLISEAIGTDGLSDMRNCGYHWKTYFSWKIKAKHRISYIYFIMTHK